MMFDSVREELQTKVTSGRLTARPEVKQESQVGTVSTPMVAKPIQPAITASSMPVHMVSRSGAAVAVARPQPSSAVAVAVAPQPARRIETADLVAPKTSPTLVGFQSKNATLPDWRIQLQNAVQQRKGGHLDAPLNGESTAVTEAPRNSAPALKAQVVPRREPKLAEPVISDQRVANALRRINDSRNAFLEPEKKAVAPTPVAASVKPYKFDVVQTNSASQVTAQPRPNITLKPRLVSAPAPLKRDTNKLPPIAMGVAKTDVAGTVSNTMVEESAVTAIPAEFSEIKRIRIRAENHEIESFGENEVEADDIEDLALFSTRFGAGLFDLIIASFASLLILSPIAFTRGEWFTPAGLLTFAGVAAIIMFLYMTICLGFYGKTMGMRLFSLELVDAVENEYPSLHQAAVSSSVFILSLVFGGAGFLTVFFNEEKRAAHDLLSGTILVREF